VGQLAVVVTVAAIFLVPTALGKGEGGNWPRGELGNVLDGALLVALGLMCAWVGWLFVTSS
jgi:hypothetical protein